MAGKPEDFPDPLIDEVRERRRQLWAEHDNDPGRILEAIRRLQAEHPEKIGDPRKSRRDAAKK